MLVLKRQAGEKVVIGNEVTIEVLAVSGEGVRLGISAPRETSVHRFEVFTEIQAANRAASQRALAKPHAAVASLAAHLRTPLEHGPETAPAAANSTPTNNNPTTQFPALTASQPEAELETGVPLAPVCGVLV